MALKTKLLKIEPEWRLERRYQWWTFSFEQLAEMNFKALFKESRSPRLLVIFFKSHLMFSSLPQLLVTALNINHCIFDILLDRI